MKLQISGLLLVMAVAYATIEAPEEFVSLAEMEDTLLRNLFRGYQKWVRPILHANDTITVRFGLKISQLVDVVRQTHICTATSGAGCINCLD
ncbi:neuronal acetylcholine receptor subunit non-alpha-3-like [Sinocyclocheilus grahami]|uniref:neuronal acetylcholine receptor subunit non-alpha-3-like n=1 Tax=Sinocyclocheilus grahami TaxID=75366 RepID=UPI0007AC88C6|nr:PREDICTED: neuronal acetylcholine receptor subunit non-alpha-3-like [Sinocyclocheilus grahami]